MIAVSSIKIVALLIVLAQLSLALRMVPQPGSTAHSLRRAGSIGGERWGDFDGFQCEVLGPIAVLNHLGDYKPYSSVDDIDSKEKIEFNLNLGKAMDTLRRNLPLVFMHDVDFSIFANSIAVTDTMQNKFQMQKSLYMGAVKSLRMAASLSSIYPAMNVRKIEFIDECRTIHCLVDVVLPDSIKVEGQAAWEGSFFFGLDSIGMINSHTFDRKITNLKPRLVPSANPFLHAVAWGEEESVTRRLVPSFNEASESQ